MSEKIVQLNEEVIKGQIKELVRGSVEETLNELLEAEAEKLTQAARYERSEARQGYRSGHYDRNLTTTSGDVTLHVPRLKGVSFETAIIERWAGTHRAQCACPCRRSFCTATYSCPYAHFFPAHAAPAAWFHLHEEPAAVPVPCAGIRIRASASPVPRAESGPTWSAWTDERPCVQAPVPAGTAEIP